jgi:hypothetical protein
MTKPFKTSKPAAPYKHATTKLGKLTHKVNQLTAINQYFRQILPQELQDLCYVANIEYGCLTFASKNSHSLTLLRFYAPDSLIKIRKKFKLTLTQSKCIIILENRIKPKNEPKLTIELSESSAENIKSVAKGISDEKLQEALLRLANQNPSSSK